MKYVTAELHANSLVHQFQGNGWPARAFDCPQDSRFVVQVRFSKEHVEYISNIVAEELPELDIKVVDIKLGEEDPTLVNVFICYKFWE